MAFKEFDKYLWIAFILYTIMIVLSVVHDVMATFGLAKDPNYFLTLGFIFIGASMIIKNRKISFTLGLISCGFMVINMMI
ncbi:hypothetical protein CD133_00260 [Staphylococcus massiliensis CCUG 55927]|uniref:Uncharacterized protein n=1 Tax=Staphylococcus massiliensis S46 TaxID=1229783 RepID=K9B7Y3_9STAP|nr:hypothetical protein C273_03060 [Staphylococcus massiliensis S46]POA02068.1 hypothetical protein CD133_00260 [Staphylococcus massiliensis CCUG 55927]